MALLTAKDLPVPTNDSYVYCYGHGCHSRIVRRLTAQETAGLQGAFGKMASNAVDERRSIGRAVAYMEKVNAPYAGTEQDVGGSFTGMFKSGQLDCVDEAINSTTTLLLLEEMGLLRYHSVYGQANRGNLLAGWPHTSATVREKETGRLFVVDSWFGNNGDAPYILDETVWAKGWDPARDPLPVDN